MPDMQPMQGPQGQPPQQAPQGGEGGGMVEALGALEQQLGGLVEAVAKSQVPDPVKQGFFQAHQAFKGAMEGLVEAAQGEQSRAPAGQETMEQGGNPGAQPLGR